MKIMTVLAMVLAMSGASWAKGKTGVGGRPQVGALDGKTFVGTSGEMGKAKSDPDTLVFKDGKLRSLACDQYGFGDGAYTTKAVGDTITFEAETTSDKEGRIKHTGTIKGDALEGKMLWQKPGQKDLEYWVKSTLKK